MVGIVTMVLIFLFPLLVMLSTAFTDAKAIFSSPPTLWPREWTIENFVAATSDVPLLRYFINTSLITVLSIGGVVLTCPLVAYSLAKLRWRGRRALFAVVVGSMMLPPQVTLIPIYIIWSGLGQTNSYLPLILPAFLGIPFLIFMLRQFALQVPDDVLDAARIDGASEWRLYWVIVVPLLRPAIATAAIFQFQMAWTDFLGPLLYINDPGMFTLSLGLNSFFGQYGIEWGPLMAACVLFTLPAIVLFLCANRFFIGGQMAGALK